MPQTFRVKVTKKGIELLQKAQAGTCRIQFSSMRTGCGSYTDQERENIGDAIALKNEKNIYPIRYVIMKDEATIQIASAISNYDAEKGEAVVSEGYHINEIGLFASDGENEILYMLAVVEGQQGDYMPPYNGYNAAEIVQKMECNIGNEKNVVLTVEQGVYALEISFEETRDRVDKLQIEVDQTVEKVKRTLPEVQYDLAEVIFQLSIKDIIETGKMKNIEVTVIDSENSVLVIHGTYTTGKVEI